MSLGTDWVSDRDLRPAAAPARPGVVPTQGSPVDEGPVADWVAAQWLPAPDAPGHDATADSGRSRVAGSVRLLLEPLLWVSFLTGLVWFLAALDPGTRAPQDGVVVYEHALPLAVALGAVLVVSSAIALAWLPRDATVARGRSIVAGLGMLGSGWLLGRLHPVEVPGFQELSWLCLGTGVWLLALCAVPWPTRPATASSRLGRGGRLVVTTLTLVAVAAVVMARDAARTGLVGVPVEARTAWDDLLPALGLLVLVLGAIRAVLYRRPARDHATRSAHGV